jgi:hypothetical protein
VSSTTQVNDPLMGKVLGRLGCGGTLHYDEAARDAWKQPLIVKIQVGEDEPIELPIVGFDLRRDQGQQMTTRITFVAVEA